MDYIKFFVIILIVWITGVSNACNNNLAMMEEQEGEMRRKRDVSGETDEISFFTKCIKEKVSTLTWEQSALYVSFTILQDVWYRAVSASVCTLVNNTDTAECWKKNVHKLLHKESDFYNATMECIDLFAVETYQYDRLDHQRKKRSPYNLYYSYLVPQQQNLLPIPRSSEECNSIFTMEKMVTMEVMKTCPKKFNFMSCMNEEQTDDTMYCDYFGKKKKYDFKNLEDFLMDDRRTCKIKMLSDTEYDFDCPETMVHGYEPKRKKRTAGYYSYFVHHTIQSTQIPLSTTTTTKTTTTTTPTTTTTTTPTTTTQTPELKLPETNCLAIKLEKVIHPEATLKKTQKECNDQAMKIENFYSDSVGYCPPHVAFWTRWFNENKPTYFSRGDRESVWYYKAKYGEIYNQHFGICDHPIAAQARTVRDHVAYSATSDNVILSPNFGLHCWNSNGVVCRDYKVRFCCPYASYQHSNRFTRPTTRPHRRRPRTEYPQ